MNLLDGRNKPKLFIAVFIIATIMALMSASINISAELAERYYELTPADWAKAIYPLIDELTGVYTFWLLVPAILAFFKRFSFNKNNFLKLIPLYLLATIVVGLTHTGLMYITRSIIYPALDLGNYNYGYIPYRIVMEYLKQFIVFWIVFIVYTIYRMNKKNEEQNLKTAKLEEQLTRARLETLKMQLNPHFLFNTLNMISSTMYEDIRAADKMIANLSDLLRITLKSSSKGENILGKEIEILNLYTDIMKARFKDKLTIELHLDKDIENAMVPNFLFQPLVENSIKYGMENLSGTKIEITAKRIETKLLIEIVDNGPGMQKNFNEATSSGVGLSNTAERLEKLYGNDFEFSWQNREEGGLYLSIEIPFKVEELQK